MFGRDWEPADATIVAMESVPIHKGDRRFHNVYVVEVRPASAPSFRVELAQPETGVFGFPERGTVIGVRCQPKAQKAKWDHADPRSFNTARKDAAQARLDAALHPDGPSPDA